ncbi:MAG: sugar kinase [Myxococcales bacterium FL481]|nr:MAG: sugar kinase [Myxococcales bacterium FL481]
MTLAKQPVLVVGSVAIDWIITPTDEREESVGGAATYFSMAASYFSPVRLVGVVGQDFPDTAINDLRGAGVDLDGLEVQQDGLTFRWKGRYHEGMNDRDTLETHLNCFEQFSPKLPAAYRDSSVLFLANIQPKLQIDVLEQVERPKIVGLDTMNLWIDIAHDELLEALRRVDVLLINREEALQLSAKNNVAAAAREIQKFGPKWLVIKQGEYGALLFEPGGSVFAAPAMPLENVVDPTGAGDSFAGGFMGSLAHSGELSSTAVRTAVLWGSAMASFCVQGFSYDRLTGLPRDAVTSRHAEFVQMMALDRGR